MALRTIGTNLTTSLSGFVVGFNDTIAADLATLNTQLRGDPPGWTWQANVAASGLVTGQGTNQPRLNFAYQPTGWLILPAGRGNIRCREGDFVAWDVTTGWPIVISGYTAANGPWTHT